MSRRRDPTWRDRAAVDLLLRELSTRDLPAPILVAGDPLPDVARSLTAAGRRVTAWSRRVCPGADIAPWPPSGPFGTVLLRHPRGKEELLMSLHAAASVLRPQGSVLVYGANDEGIRSALRTLEEVFFDARTLAVGGRCRVLGSFPGRDIKGLRGSLESWRTLSSLNDPRLPERWVSYPGVFAHGRLDEGTRLLLDLLPSVPSGSRVLDYGCGSGVIGCAVSRLGKGVKVELLDVDAVALEAARENLPGARLLLRDGLPSPEGAYDAILSNPPFHRGKSEAPEMILAFVQAAPFHLRDSGELVFVCQRRLPVERALRGSFGRVEMLGEDSTFRVWRGRKPRTKRRR